MMTAQSEDRAAMLHDLAATLSEDDDVLDAFVAKSFTDRHVVVDLRAGVPVDSIVDRLAEYDLFRAQEVYGDDHGAHFFASEIGDAVRYHFVDVQTCGDHQSYVVK